MYNSPFYIFIFPLFDDQKKDKLKIVPDNAHYYIET